MAVIVSCSGISKSYGSRPLFENLTLALHEGQRYGLTGPNGRGKSTLMRILAGEEVPDLGIRALRKQCIVAYVPQDSVYAPGQTIAQVLEQALKDLDIDAAEAELRIAIETSRATFRDLNQEAASLSGGWRKRLAIVSALVRHPQALLLDEPTNHLDIEGILWLERMVLEADFATLFISHDRYFLEKVANHMAEINPTYPDGIFSAEGNYSRFLEKREEFLSAQQKLQDSLESKVRREIEWLRQGAKARTTKAKSRIDEANRLMEELSDVSNRNRQVTASVELLASGRQTRRLIDGLGLQAAPGGRPLFTNLDITLVAGTRLGLVGANGAGKSTLLKVLSGEILADAGTLYRADMLRIAVLDQRRRLADEGTTLQRALCPDGDTVLYQGKPVHVAGWARRFLFQPEQLIQPVSQLSGGERARVLLANLMLTPADVLFLDEPTNDLDIPTLQVLEENLLEFAGALVLVTHDRYLLDRVASTVLALEGDGRFGFYADYSQWEQEQSTRRPLPKKEVASSTISSPTAAPKKRLSFKEQRELESIEARILEAESQLQVATAAIEKSEIYSDHHKLRQKTQEMQDSQKQVDALYARWAELEAKVKS